MAASTHLALLGEASRLLAEAKTLDEIKTFRDKAEAARSYIKAARMGLEAQNRAAEAKLRAERKAGKLLSSMKLRGGNRKSKSPDVTLKLDSLGISRNQSADWQRLAAVSETDFLAYLQTMNEHGREITSIGLLRTTCKKCSRERGSGDIVVMSNGHAKTTNPDESFTELNNHCQLLHEILKTSPQAANTELRRSDRQIAERLVADIAKLAVQIQKSIPPMICQGCERYRPDASS